MQIYVRCIYIYAEEQHLSFRCLRKEIVTKISHKLMLLLATVDSKVDSVDQQVNTMACFAGLKSVSASESRAENPHKFIITCAKRKQTGWCKSA
jgi:hypothetical protein